MTKRAFDTFTKGATFLATASYRGEFVYLGVDEIRQADHLTFHEMPQFLTADQVHTVEDLIDPSDGRFSDFRWEDWSERLDEAPPVYADSEREHSLLPPLCVLLEVPDLMEVYNKEDGNTKLHARWLAGEQEWYLAGLHGRGWDAYGFKVDGDKRRWGLFSFSGIANGKTWDKSAPTALARRDLSFKPGYPSQLGLPVRGKM